MLNSIFTVSECFVGKGEAYRGFRNTTRSGRKCQNWNSNRPHEPHSCCTPTRQVGLVNWSSSSFFIRCVLQSVLEGPSVHPLVRPSVRRSVSRSVTPSRRMLRRVFGLVELQTRRGRMSCRSQGRNSRLSTCPFVCAFSHKGQKACDISSRKVEASL